MIRWRWICARISSPAGTGVSYAQFLVGGVLEATTNLREPVRILIVDDHRLFAESLELILDADGRIEIAGHAGTGEEAIDVARSARPDVVLMDIAMPVMAKCPARRS